MAGLDKKSSQKSKPGKFSSRPLRGGARDAPAVGGAQAIKGSGASGGGAAAGGGKQLYEQMAPIIEGIKRVEKRNRDKNSIKARIQAVAPPPAKAPHTTLLPPKADGK